MKVQTIINEVNQRIYQMEIATIAIDKQKEKLITFIDNVAVRLNDDTRDKLAHYLYWEIDVIGGNQIVKSLYGKNAVGPNELKRIGPKIDFIDCSYCSKPVKFERYSRSGRIYEVCPECKEIRKQNSKINAKLNGEYQQKIDRQLAELKALPYSEYLQTAHWKEQRIRALKFYGFHCALCNVSNTKLHIHHRTYDRIGEEYVRDLIVLCQQCHEKFHDIEIKE